MRSLLALFILVSGFIQCAIAQDAPITVDGETFSKKFVGNPPNGDKLLEFIRDSESFDNWTKLVGLRYQKLPGAGNDPKTVAAGLARIVKASNPNAQSRVIINDQSSEAIIDFLTWPPDGKYMEFNVFRYAKSTDGKAVVSLQFAYRFAAGNSPEVIEQFKKLRASWINQAAAFDMKNVHAFLAE